MSKKDGFYEGEEKIPPFLRAKEREQPFLFDEIKEELSLEKSLKPVAQKLSYTKKESFLKLLEIQELALSMEPKPDFTAALRSEELKGKLFGLYQDKKSQDPPSEVQVFPTALVKWVDSV